MFFTEYFKSPNVICCYLVFFASFLSSCNSGQRDLMKTESILSEGQSIHAKNRNGSFGCRWTSALEREYWWEGKKKIVKMIPREERWKGSLGLYNPASSLISFAGQRVVCQEGQLYFESNQEAREWLSKQRPFDWVFSVDGLVGGFFQSPQRQQVNIEFWQIYVHGHKPTDFNSSPAGSIEIK
jgi:hypothetical protein